MSLRSAPSICLAIFATTYFAFAANPEHPSPMANISVNDTHIGLICSPFGICEPCPEEALGEPFCKLFGNRHLMHCVNATSSHTSSHGPLPPSHGPPPSGHGTPPPGGAGDYVDFKAQHPEGETLARESCGRIVSQERADFYEFVVCNILFAAIALLVLFARSIRLDTMRARQLAARIRIIRNVNTGGRR